MLPLKLRSGSQVGPGTGRYQAGASSRKPLPEHMLTGELSYKPGGSHDAAPGSGVWREMTRVSGRTVQNMELAGSST